MKFKINITFDKGNQHRYGKRLKIKQERKIASLGKQEPQPVGTAKWPTTLRVEKPQDALQKIHRP